MTGTGLDAPPLTLLEEVVLLLWRELFDNPEIGIDDDFFALGGNSVLAAEIAVRIAGIIHVDLPLHQLFQTPTIAQLASALSQLAYDKEMSSSYPPGIVPMQPRGSRRSLFCIHALGGSVFGMQPLALHLSRDQPVYGVEARGVNGNDAPLATVRELAAHAISTMRQMQPRGPYQLIGQSAGGLIAFEMAHQLQAAGEQIATLILLDSYLVRENVEPLIRFKLRPAVGKLRSVRSAVRGMLRGGHLPSATGVEAAARSEEAEGDGRRHRSAVEIATRDAIAHYRPSIYRGRVVYFYAQDRTGGSPLDQVRHWRSLVPADFVLYEVPGRHLTFLRSPHVERVAELVNAEIDRNNLTYP